MSPLPLAEADPISRSPVHSIEGHRLVALFLTASACMLLRPKQARPMNQVTSQVLGDKVAVVHRLASHSEVLEREMDVYRDAPGHMQQWLAENKQAEVYLRALAATGRPVNSGRFLEDAGALK